jgi:MazG family protein
MASSSEPEGIELAAEVQAGVVDPSGAAFRDVVEVMAKLRAPDGCPWDREQTHSTLARHLLEETYEVLEAIDSGDASSLREELGDLLLQVLFHAQLAFEEGVFSVADVCEVLRAKLVRRHPHVFGDVDVSGADQVLANWEKLKREEKGTGIMDGVPAALPALARAEKLSRRASQAGFDFPDVASRLQDVDDELIELRAEIDRAEPDLGRVESELGDVLFAVAALGRRLGLEPETALRRSADAFERRFRAMERLASDDHRELESLSADEWTRYWERVKAAEGDL